MTKFTNKKEFVSGLLQVGNVYFFHRITGTGVFFYSDPITADRAQDYKQDCIDVTNLPLLFLGETHSYIIKPLFVFLYDNKYIFSGVTFLTDKFQLEPITIKKLAEQ